MPASCYLARSGGDWALGVLLLWIARTRAREFQDFKFLSRERGVLCSRGYQIYSTIYFVVQGQAGF